MKKYDVVTLGELLIDFTGSGQSPQGNPLFECNPGGSVGNCVAMVAKLGHKTAFIGKVGDDFLGKFLVNTLEELDIDTRGISFDKDVRTTLAFVHNGEHGERDFAFFRNPGADIMLTKEDVPYDILRDTKIFHMDSLSMSHEPCRSANKEALRVAKEAGAVISFDPTFRNTLWDDFDDARKHIWFGIENCDVLKIADDEIEFLTGKSVEEGMEEIMSRTSATFASATLGPDGSIIYYKGKKIIIPPFRLKETIETTGAGDTYCGSILEFVLKYGLDGFDEEKVKEAATFANAAAALITTRKGALRVMPDRAEVEALIKKGEL